MIFLKSRVWKDLLNRFYELVDKGVQLIARRPVLPQTDVKRIVEIGLVVRASVQIRR
jgi:hypothetical protein